MERSARDMAYAILQTLDEEGHKLSDEARKRFRDSVNGFISKVQ